MDCGRDWQDAIEIENCRNLFARIAYKSVAMAYKIIEGVGERQVELLATFTAVATVHYQCALEFDEL